MLFLVTSLIFFANIGSRENASFRLYILYVVRLSKCISDSSEHFWWAWSKIFWVAMATPPPNPNISEFEHGYEDEDILTIFSAHT